MLLYLDNAQFAWLERLPVDKQRAFAGTLASVGAEIVLSPLHLQEFGQLHSVEQRLNVLEVLEPVWLARSTYEILRSEISLSLERMRGRVTPPTSAVIRDLLLPIDLAEIAETLRSRKPIFDTMREAFQLGAAAEGLTKGAPPAPRTVGLPTEAQIKERLEQAREIILSGLPEGSSMREAIEDTLQSVGEMHLAGMRTRDVQRQVLGIADMKKIKGAPVEDFPNISVLRHLALKVCLEAGGPGDCREVVTEFDPYDCPGFRLKAAAHRARLKHPKPPEPGDQIDEDHLVYGPYMDVMFVDKRTRSFVHQEAGRSHGLLNSEDAAAVTQASDLTEVLRVVRSHADSVGGAS